MNSSIIRRLAIACTRGSQQQSLVNEMLVGPVAISHDRFSIDQCEAYGQTGLSGESYRNLRRRLTAVGFVLVRDRDRRTITLTFPEGTK